MVNDLAVNDLQTRIAQLKWILSRVRPVPDDWLEDGKRKDSSGGDKLKCLPCKSYKALVTAWRKALRWTDGLDHGLSACLASVVSVRSVGSQLWLKLIGPPASGKSTLCEALAVNEDYVFAKSKIRGFHSGYKSDREGKEDSSLLEKLRNKTFVIKDGDTLLRSPNLSEILSEGRDLYDGTSRSHYRNKMGKNYTGIRMTWILAGTKSLRLIDSSELGERFLDVVIMEDIDPDLENEILLRAAYRAERNIAIEADGKAESQYDKSLALAYQLTGGYIDYLRENASELLQGVVMSDAARHQCIHFGLFVAYMRARPSPGGAEDPGGRELGARLVEQHIRLAMCLTVVMNKTEVDSAVLARVRRVALDTSRGKTLSIVRSLFAAEEEGLMSNTLSLMVDATDYETRRMLVFLKRIDVVEMYRPKKSKGVRMKTRWRLTKRLTKLYRSVFGDNDG